jgi:cardiolipin synthase
MNLRYLPNLITLLRIVLIPAVAYYLVVANYVAALPIFMIAAISDFADGYLARRLAVASKLGATLDPVADKLNMLVATVLLAWHALLPTWLAIAIVARDVLIVAGALIYRSIMGRLDIAPTLLSKLNTVLEFSILLWVMANAAGWIGGESWREPAFMIVGATVVASGVQYAWLWGARAVAERFRR